MDLEIATIDNIVDRLRELFEADRRSPATDELLEMASAWERVGVVADAARIWVAAEVDAESRRELGADGLAYRNSFPTAKKLLAASANVSERTASSRVQLGRQIRSHLSNTGLSCPSRFPVVERAFFAGRIGADTATVICRTLSEVAARTTFNTRLDEAEQYLVDAATVSFPLAGSAHETSPVRLYTVDDIARLAIRIRENLDPDGAEPRDEAKQQLRGFSHPRVGSDGMARGRYALPPLQLGVFLTAVDSIMSPRTADPEVPASDGIDQAEVSAPTPPEERSYEQKLLDAVMTLVEMGAGSPSASLLNGAAPTVIVHVAARDLESGRGVGWIDGSSEPIPSSTVAMLQCTGNTIVSLFGADGEILNHGKTRRIATRKQRRALAARDGGCVFPGCQHPPSRCQAHHVIPWVGTDFAAGATDVDNMALLCAFHHSTIHTSAWQLTMIRGKPHIISPAWIDPHRTPRPAAKQRAADPW